MPPHVTFGSASYASSTLRIPLRHTHQRTTAAGASSTSGAAGYATSTPWRTPRGSSTRSQRCYQVVRRDASGRGSQSRGAAWVHLRLHRAEWRGEDDRDPDDHVDPLPGL